MSNNTKEKDTRISLRISQSDKEKIQRIAEQCGLSTTEYITKRALGYRPKSAVPDAFYLFNQTLCELLNRDLSPELETAALKLFDEIHRQFVAVPKQSAKEIKSEVSQWQQQATGR